MPNVGARKVAGHKPSDRKRVPVQLLLSWDEKAYVKECLKHYRKNLKISVIPMPKDK